MNKRQESEGSFGIASAVASLMEQFFDGAKAFF